MKHTHRTVIMVMFYVLVVTFLIEFKGVMTATPTPLHPIATSSIPYALYQNRRLALEQTVPPNNPKVVLIDFSEQGRRVPVDQALNPKVWEQSHLYDNTTVGNANLLLESSNYAHATPSTAIACPRGPIRVFVGIQSRCCTPSAVEKRNAIRNSWLHTIQTEYSDIIHAQFIISQPEQQGTTANVLASSTPALHSEVVDHHHDIAIVPTTECYNCLPEKTLLTLKYALSSPCNYTHILKTDDDVYLRPHRLLDIIYKHERNYELEILNPVMRQSRDSSTTSATTTAEVLTEGEVIQRLGTFDGRRINSTADEAENLEPWMHGMYVGKLDSNRTNVFPGFWPLNGPNHVNSKWYLPETELPTTECPLGVRWNSGWGYFMSRDVAEIVWNTAVNHSLRDGNRSVRWWGRLWWEDVMVAALLSEHPHVRLSHHNGFKAAWDGCDSGVVLKHLDNEAPALTLGLWAQEESGLWGVKEVVCSAGEYDVNDYDGWRVWRNQFNAPNQQM